MYQYSRASVLEPPEDGMDFSAALEKEFAIADHGRRSVQRTYSGKDRANGHDHVFESSQRTLVNPSQASPRRRSSPHRERFASPSRLRQGRRRETIAARPVDPDQDEDDLSHASPPRILTAGRSRKGKQPENQAATQEFLVSTYDTFEHDPTMLTMCRLNCALGHTHNLWLLVGPSHHRAVRRLRRQLT
jgi:hypothetical protein